MNNVPVNMGHRCKELVNLFNKAPIKNAFGMTLSYNSDYEAEFTMNHNPDLEHALKDTHGGVIMTLLDNAGWFTAAARYNTWIVTNEIKINLLEPAKRSNLLAAGRLVRVGNKLAVTRMEVRNDSNCVIAIASGSFYITSVNY